MAEQALSRALEVVFEVIGSANRYVDAQAPWALRRTDPDRMATVLYVLAEVIRRLALVTQAFMPDASGKILDQLGVPDEARSLASFEEVAAALQPGAALPVPSGVFPRFADRAR
jgi:methionyl-tRNA synthetase